MSLSGPLSAPLSGRITKAWDQVSGEVVYSSGVVLNVRRSAVQRFKAGITRVKAAGGDCRIGSVGDSTRGGTGSDGPAGNGLRNQSAPYQEAGIIQSRQSISVQRENTYGSMGKNITNLALYDTKITANSATIAASNTAPGGLIFNHALTTGAMRLTPPTAFDRCMVRWKGNANTRDIVWLTSTGQTGSLAGDNSFAYKQTELALTSCTWIEFRSNQNATVEFWGFEFYTAAGSKLHWLNLGWGGSEASDWGSASGGGTRPIVSLPLMGLDGITVGLGINSILPASGKSAATIKSELKAFLSPLMSSMDILGLVPGPLDPAKYGDETTVQGPKYQAIREAYLELNLPYVDFKLLQGTFANAQANSWMSDSEHQLAAGYGVQAVPVADFIDLAMVIG
jgi:hypothetical protein